MASVEVEPGLIIKIPAWMLDPASCAGMEIGAPRASPRPTVPDLAGLADDLKVAWNAPGVSMRARQRLVRTLIMGIIVDVDEEARDVLLTIHWMGGRHSRLRVRKPKSGEHGCRTPEEALAVIRSMAGRWSDEHIAASLTACFMDDLDDFEACIAHLRMPITHRRAIRTTNLLERLFVEERRRLKIIPNAFGEKAVLKLMFGAMIRAAECWRAIRISELERRQMRAVREELNHEYEAQNGLAAKTSATAPRTKISSTART